jgi:hypothetical protein
MKTIFFPINSSALEKNFTETMSNQIPIIQIEKFLFPKLLNTIKSSHRSGSLSLWGMEAGEKSTNANKWNLLMDGDLAVFSFLNGNIALARIVEKFQSENIANNIWNSPENSVPKQYLLTFSDVTTLSDEEKGKLLSILKQQKISLDQLELYDRESLTLSISEMNLTNFEPSSLQFHETLPNLLARVLDLQMRFTSSNSDFMKERGIIIRDHLPKLLQREILDELRIRSEIQDLEVAGSDGVGLKSEIPYVRFYSPELSPRPTIGWYLVLLFKADGTGVYLTLSHASTKNVSDASGNLQFVSRSPKEMRNLMDWASAKVGSFLPSLPRTVSQISLQAARSNLGSAYESTALISYLYDLTNLPSLDDFSADISSLLPLLKVLYDAQTNDPTQPGKHSPEFISSINEIEVQAGSRRAKSRVGQGFGLTALERKAVELQAVELAISYYKSLGYTKIEDVGAFESYDLKVESEMGTLFVEVKGTTSPGETVILTRNEVALHQREYPSNALFIVTHIQLEKGDEPKASGGIPRVISPWKILHEALNPLGYEYQVPSEDV